MFNLSRIVFTLSAISLFSSCAPGTVSITDGGSRPAQPDSSQNQTSITTTTSVYTNPNSDTPVANSTESTATTVITISTMVTETTIESITVVTTVTETQTITETDTVSSSGTETQSVTETDTETQTESATATDSNTETQTLTSSETGTSSSSSTGTSSYSYTNTNTNTNTNSSSEYDEENYSHKPPKIQLTSEYEITVENEVGQLDLNTLQVKADAGISFSVSNIPQDNLLRITTQGEGFVNVMICNTYKVCAEKKLNVKNKKDNSNKKKVAFLEVLHPDGIIDEDDSAPFSQETEEQMIRRRLQRMARGNQKRRANVDLDDLIA